MHIAGVPVTCDFEFVCTGHDIVWVNTVGTYGLGSASYWWGRLGALIQRIVLYIVGPSGLRWALRYADDFILITSDAQIWRPLLYAVALLRALGVPLAAFTATADAETQAEIVQKLFDGTPPTAFLRGFDRPNIHLMFGAKNSPRNQILNFAAARRGQSGIVYCGTRAKTEGIARALNEAGQTAIHYHGGMEAEDRRIAERRFQQEDGLIVAATVAFGMGIDKPDIRWVAHADLPKSIESYYQEIGRAGRDGAPAETLTLFGPDDIRLRRTQIDEGLAPPERRAADHGRLNALLGLAEALECRRKTLLGYFDETDVSCGRCDLCDTPGGF